MAKATLRIVVERDGLDGPFCVTDNKTLVYGDGPTVPAAIQDYATCLLEYADILAEAASKGLDRERCQALHELLNLPVSA